MAESDKNVTSAVLAALDARREQKKHKNRNNRRKKRREMSARPTQELKLVGTVCERYGVTVENARVQISDGRKVGFIVDFGELPRHKNCFVTETPTPSTSQERSRTGKALCFLPNGFKVVGVVDGSVYLGEVVYALPDWKRAYKFHLLDGEQVVATSQPCTNPTSAFKEIEQAIFEQAPAATKKKKTRRPDARSNGKLYMAVMYSATQRQLRSHFRLAEVNPNVQDIFQSWLQADDERLNEPSPNFLPPPADFPHSSPPLEQPSFPPPLGITNNNAPPTHLDFHTPSLPQQQQQHEDDPLDYVMLTKFNSFSLQEEDVILDTDNMNNNNNNNSNNKPSLSTTTTTTSWEEDKLVKNNDSNNNNNNRNNFGVSDIVGNNDRDFEILDSLLGGTPGGGSGGTTTSIRNPKLGNSIDDSFIQYSSPTPPLMVQSYASTSSNSLQGNPQQQDSSWMESFKQNSVSAPSLHHHPTTTTNTSNSSSSSLLQKQEPHSNRNHILGGMKRGFQEEEEAGGDDALDQWMSMNKKKESSTTLRNLMDLDTFSKTSISEPNLLPSSSSIDHQNILNSHQQQDKPSNNIHHIKEEENPPPSSTEFDYASFYRNSISEPNLFVGNTIQTSSLTAVPEVGIDTTNIIVPPNVSTATTANMEDNNNVVEPEEDLYNNFSNQFDSFVRNSRSEPLLNFHDKNNEASEEEFKDNNNINFTTRGGNLLLNVSSMSENNLFDNSRGLRDPSPSSASLDGNFPNDFHRSRHTRNNSFSYGSASNNGGGGGFGTRKRSSGSLDENDFSFIPNSRKRGSIDEGDMVPGLVKRESSGLENDLGMMEEEDSKKMDVILEAINNYDPSMFNDLLNNNDDLEEDKSKPQPTTATAASAPKRKKPPLLKEFSENFGGSAKFNISELYDMNASQLFQALKNPAKETLSLRKIEAALSTLLQIPRGSVPKNFCQEIFQSCDVHQTGEVTMETFVQALNKREDEVKEQFNKIDKDRNGVITMNELREAREEGLIGKDVQESDLHAFVEKMDDLSLGVNEEYAWDRKIQYSEFRTMMILLPPATSIQQVINFVKKSLLESDFA